MQGIPNGRSSDVPGFGIITLLVGLDFPVSSKESTSANLWDGVKDLMPSTPAVDRPWLSCVTFLMDKSLADLDFIKSFWSL